MAKKSKMAPSLAPALIEGKLGSLSSLSHEGWHLGSRLNVLDMVRITEQTSILLSELTGLEPLGISAKSFKHFVVPWFLGALRHAFCNPLIIHRDEGDMASEVGRWWTPFGRKVYKRRKHPRCKAFPEFDLDLVCSVLDGASSLRTGRTGSLSVIAGGERGCFIPDSESAANKAYGRKTSKGTIHDALPDQFFAIVAGPHIATSDAPAIFGKATKADLLRPTPGSVVPGELIDDFLEREGPLRNIVELIRQRGGRPTLGVCREGFAEWTCPATTDERRVVLEGSTVGAAITALLRTRGIDAACMFCRRTQAIQIATACKALAGAAWFVPITGGSSKPPRVAASLGPPVFRETTLVPGRHAFLIATGVTPGRSLFGVECHDGGRVLAHTFCLSTFHRSKRRLSNSFDLTRVAFVDPNGIPLPGNLAIDQFRQQVRARIMEATATQKTTEK